VTPRGFTQYKYTAQERLSKDDIRLLIEAVDNSKYLLATISNDRYHILIDKLKRMEKQK